MNMNFHNFLTNYRRYNSYLFIGFFCRKNSGFIVSVLLVGFGEYAVPDISNDKFFSYSITCIGSKVNN